MWGYILIVYLTKSPEILQWDIWQLSWDVLNNDSLTGNVVIWTKIDNFTGETVVKETNLTWSDQKERIIVVVMPDHFYNKWFEDISNKLYKDYRLKVDFKTIKWISSYKDYLIDTFSWVQTGIDLFLVPTDWMRSFEDHSLKMDFTKDISMMFTSQFYDHIKADKYTMIPFSLDPFVTLMDKNFYKDSLFTLKWLSDALFIEPEWPRKLFNDIRLMFWFWRNDILLLQIGKESYDDYFMFLYNIVYQAYLSLDYRLLQSFIDYSKEGNVRFRDEEKFKKFLKIASQSNPECYKFKSLCMLSNWYWDVVFGFLSYMNAYDKYFTTGKISSSDIAVYNFLNNSNEYPVRWRWFFINKYTWKLSDTLLFVNKYIKEWSSWSNMRLWWNNLSAFNEILNKQRIQKEYSKIFEFETKFELIEWDVNIQKEFIKKTPILQVLKWEYSVEAFLDNLEWIF